MRAMMLDKPKSGLILRDTPTPKPAAGQVLLRVGACAVCRTDLHIVDGELSAPKLPLILGHQIVGRIEKIGGRAVSDEASPFRIGDRVGVPWLGWTDGNCIYCRSGRENLCDNAKFTGYTIDGGYAEYAVADARFCFPLPDGKNDTEVAPLLCAGLIGFRAYRKIGNAHRLGIYGFGNAATLITQVALFERREVYAFTRPGDAATQKAARSLGCAWAGDSDEAPPEKLDAAIIFASVGPLVPAALKNIVKGGIVVCGGIHMSDIPAFSYDDLWGERTITSVANLTRQDGEEFLRLAPQVPVKTKVQEFPLEQANEALAAFRSGKTTGTPVLKVIQADFSHG